MDARASVEAQVVASLTQARQELRFQASKVAELEKTIEDFGEVEKDRDELRAIVGDLEMQVERLSSEAEEGRVWKGKAMQQAQALEKERVNLGKAQINTRKLKEGKQPKERVEGGEEKGVSKSTM